MLFVKDYPDLMRKEEVADVLRCKPITVPRLKGLRKTFLYNGKKSIRYRKEDVILYINSKVEREEVIKDAVNKRRDTGKWGYRHYFRGRNYRKHVWGSRDEAVEAYKELLDRLRRNVSITDSDTPLVEVVNKFLEYSARIGKSESRLRALYCNFKSFIIPFFKGQRRLREITHQDIESFIHEQLKKPIERNTINHYIIDLNSLLNWAVKEEIIGTNPVRKIDRMMKRPEKVIKDGHTPEQIRRCEFVLNSEELLFFRFLKNTGARLN